MKFDDNSDVFTLNRTTYVNLRWIAFIGQISSIFVVEFLLNFKFNYLPCLIIIGLGVITNIFLQFKIRENQINNFISSIYLTYDILQLGILFFFDWWNNKSIYFSNNYSSSIFISVSIY